MSKTTNGEQWKPITDRAVKGYEVSSQGRVRNAESGKVLSAYQNKLVVFSVDGKAVCRSVGKLVAEAFIGKIKKGVRVHRINEERAFTVKNIRIGGEAS